jgi:predicted nucleic acid-binding Zn ribbon protein
VTTSLDRPRAPVTEHCTLCGAALERDQEWCLECGAARTTIHSAPDWRIAAGVILAVVVLAVAGFWYGLHQLTANSAPGIKSGSASTNTSPPSSGTTTTALASWPPGLDGYTVVLASEPTQAAAVTDADRLVADRITGIGVLATAEHPGLKPAHTWEVFAGRYPTHAQAAEAAIGLLRRGQVNSTVVNVQPPGGP